VAEVSFLHYCIECPVINLCHIYISAVFHVFTLLKTLQDGFRSQVGHHGKITTARDWYMWS